MEHAASLSVWRRGSALHRHRTFRKDGKLAISNITRSVSHLFFVIAVLRSHQRFLGTIFRSRQQKGVFPIRHKIIKWDSAIGLSAGRAAFRFVIIGLSDFTPTTSTGCNTLSPFSSSCCLNYISAVFWICLTSVLSPEPKDKNYFIFQVVTIMVYLLLSLLN